MSVDYDMQPETPLHPEADEELLDNGINLANVENSLLNIQLDLNPELSEDDDDEFASENCSNLRDDINSLDQNDINSNDNEQRDQSQKSLKAEADDSDSDDDENVIFEDVLDKNSKRKLELDLQYEEIRPNATVGEPMIETENGLIYLKSDSIFGVNPVEFTSDEKSGVINYIETEMLRIQRKIVQSFNDTASNENGYWSLKYLLEDLTKLTDFLWFTIKLSQFKDKKIPDTSNMVFYLGQYLIKLAGDLVDFVGKFKIGQYLENLIIYIKRLDLMFSKIMNDINGYDSTDRVRISSITERTRILVVTKTIEEDNDEYKFEIGRLYENTIESINGDEFT